MRYRFWNIRHWLITKLACGDMIMMNFERRCTGNIVPKNLGDALIHNVEIEGMLGESDWHGNGRFIDLAKRSALKIERVAGVLLQSRIMVDGRWFGFKFEIERDHVPRKTSEWFDL